MKLQKMQVENGIIVPPPDIRTMVDKAARFVASIKPRLEKFIAMNAGMRKYTFLNGADPYHAYYQQRLSEFRAQIGSNKKPWPKLLTPDKNAAVIEWILKSCESMDESFAVCDTVIVSPITGDLITYNRLTDHMQDPKYKEEKERLFAKIRETTHAQDDVISRTIFEIARTDPDSFGTTEKEVFDAVMAEIESTNPDSKKRRLLLDDSSLLLVPEDEFLAQNPGPVCISVWVPYKRRMLEVRVESLSESVSSLKEKIAGQIEEAPPANKLNLSGLVSGVFKDRSSLAYYNVAGAEMVSLSW